MAGEQPTAAPTTLDTYTDKDASSSDPRPFSAHQELPGATSKDVHASAGQPGTGMSSKELRHNAQPSRKKEGFGTEARFGNDTRFSDDVEL